MCNCWNVFLIHASIILNWTAFQNMCVHVLFLNRWHISSIFLPYNHVLHWYFTEAKEYSNLQEAGVRLVPHSTCTMSEVYGGHVTSDMICAGTNHCVDACQVREEIALAQNPLVPYHSVYGIYCYKYI